MGIITGFRRLVSNTTSVFLGADRDEAASNAANGTGSHPDLVNRFSPWPSLKKYDNDSLADGSPSPFASSPNPDYIWKQPVTAGQTVAFAIASDPSLVGSDEEMSFSVFLAAFADNAMEAKIELFKQEAGVFIKDSPQPSGLSDFLLVAGLPDDPAFGLAEAPPINWQNIRFYSTRFSVFGGGVFRIVVSFEATNYLLNAGDNPAGLRFVVDIYQSEDLA